MRTIYVILLLSLILPLQLSSSGRPWQKHLKGKSLKVNIPPLSETRLSNGIKVYYVKNDLLPRAQISVVIEGGVYEEPANLAGLTKLWGEAVVLSGSSNYPRTKLARLLETNAASFSFDDGFERMSFSFSSLTDYFTTGLRVVFDVIKNPRFADEDIALLRKQLLQAVKKRKENPARLGFLASRLKAYENTLRGRVTTTKSIKGISKSKLIEWQKRLIAQKRISIVLAGDFNLPEIKSLLNSELGSLKTGAAVNTRVLKRHDAYDQHRQKLFYIEKQIPQTTVILKSRGIVHKSSEYYALKLYDFILGGDSFNSHLMQEIRVKRGWAYSVYSSYRAGRFVGDINIFAQSTNKNVPQLIDRFSEILRKPEAFITAKRLQGAKQSLTNKYVFLYETPGQLASVRLAMKYDGLPDNYLDTYLKNINAVTLEQVLAVARKYYRPENFFFVLVGPKNVWQGKKTTTTAIEALQVPE